MRLDYAWTRKATFTLKHVTTLSKEQDVRFLGKRLQLHDENSISISLEPSTGTTCYDPTTFMVTMLRL